MYNVYIVAFPQDCDLEERLDEMLMNYEFSIEKPTYSCIIEDVNMTNVPEELANYIENGFKEEENV
jgi:hypothetical protein